ncbi:hypothetical protein IPH25_00080 [bacterium]|nr:MAG: hypothetical protein IPG37_02195 [bacterium]QQR61831.1 MAG: hypothetical protein IPH25_00080 [bacterium]QQR62587.1 MAG: hypothetical protein IPH67_04175 [bacterium]
MIKYSIQSVILMVVWSWIPYIYAQYIDFDGSKMNGVINQSSEFMDMLLKDDKIKVIFRNGKSFTQATVDLSNLFQVKKKATDSLVKAEDVDTNEKDLHNELIVGSKKVDADILVTQSERRKNTFVDSGWNIRFWKNSKATGKAKLKNVKEIKNAYLIDAKNKTVVFAEENGFFNKTIMVKVGFQLHQRGEKYDFKNEYDVFELPINIDQKMLPAAVIDNNGSKVAIFQESTKSIIEISSKGKKSLIPFFKITEDKTPNQYIRSFFDHRTPVDIHYIQDGYLLVYDDCYCTIKKHEKQWKLEKKEMLTYEIVQSQPSQPTQFSFSIQPQNTLKTHDISVVKSIFDQGNNTLYCLYTYKKGFKTGQSQKNYFGLYIKAGI